MALLAVSGSKFYIGTRVALPSDLTVELTDFAGQEAFWLEVSGWTNAGSIGDAREAIAQNFISADRTLTIGGTRNSPEMQNVFAPDANDPGQIRMREAMLDCANYAFKIEWGADCARESVVEISVASAAVVTWPGGHGLEDGSPVLLEGEGGTLPTGLTSGTVYYSISTGPTTFNVSATPGGPPIATTAAGTATSINATSQPAGMTDLFYGLVMSTSKNGGEANTALMTTMTVKPNTSIISV